MKQKSRKSLQKRFKLSAKGKLIRRHQLGAGHLKRKKSKGALNRQKKTTTVFITEAKKLKRLISI
ncbi:MAG: 50S ribosomal protein L35 [Candidatus Daviesbacteria bacterium]|nr:MAG: 50S ribosomal protein L35 [Candidatus Daviesbacteria bacterium]